MESIYWCLSSTEKTRLSERSAVGEEVKLVVFLSTSVDHKIFVRVSSKARAYVRTPRKSEKSEVIGRNNFSSRGRLFELRAHSFCRNLINLRLPVSYHLPCFNQLNASLKSAYYQLMKAFSVDTRTWFFFFFVFNISNSRRSSPYGQTFFLPRLNSTF